MEEEKLFDTVKCVKADHAVRTAMEEYQRYLLDSKLPNPIDGLKDVTRRAIYVMGIRKDYIKFAQFIASVMEVHPHGDSSIKSAVERLFRTWDVRIPLVQCDGNIGSYTEIAGAPRYLEVSSSEFARDLFFNNVCMSTIPMQYTVEFKSYEPKYLIPRLPNALLMGNLTIGVGFKSVIFPFNIVDVCTMVQKYIEQIQKDPIHVAFASEKYPSLFIPDFPTFCYLRNEKEIIKDISDGNFYTKVATDGVLQITKHTIVIKSMPALVPMDKIHERLVNVIKQKNHWINTYLKDFKDTISEKDFGSLKLIFKNNVDTWKILPRIKQLINFTSTLTPIYSYEFDSKLITLTPPQVLKYWYDARYQSIVNGLNVDQNQLLKENLIIDALLYVVDRKKEVVDTVTNAEDGESAARELADKFNITLHQATAIVDTAIRKLTKASKGELYKRKEDIKKKIQDINSKFSKVPEIIYNDAIFFKKKYGNERRTLIPKYIGYVHIGDDGIYQYTTEDELFSILNEFTGISMTIHPYNSTTSKKLVVSGTKSLDYGLWSLPRQDNGSYIVELDPSHKKVYTIAHVGDTVSCVHGFMIPKDPKITVQYVDKKFIGVLSDGTIAKMTVDELSTRKSISSGSRSPLEYAVPYSRDQQGVLVYMSNSPDYINHLFLTPIYNKNMKLNTLLTTPPHTFTILDTVPRNGTGIILNIPRSCVNIAIEYLYISDISALTNGVTANINLRSGVYKLVNGKKSKPTRHANCNSMVII